jgi:hypothetical protein
MADKIKLKMALKLKNRLVGEIQRLKSIISRENIKREDQERKINSLMLMRTQLTVRINELINIKTSIAKANVGIYDKIVEMEENKSLIAYWERFNCEESRETIYDSVPPTQLKLIPAIDRMLVDEIIVDLKRKIDVLQDEIDEYNAVTYI